MSIRVGVWGATGYTGYEIIRMLLTHPDAELVFAAAKIDGDTALSAVFPDLLQRTDIVCRAGGDPPELDVAFLAVPHRIAMGLMPSALDAAPKVIDLSADYRLKDVSVYEKWYGTEHSDTGRLASAVYGLPELYREQIACAEVIANPGCYPTASILAVAPLADNCSIERVIIDAKTGISGGGRNPSMAFHYPECNESVRAYKVGMHQHEPEIAQVLSDAAGKSVDVLFAPHIVPMTRGIAATLCVDLDKEVTEEALYRLYEGFYADEPFVRVRKDIPATKDVVNSNFCDIAVRARGKTAIIMSCIDNLLKGAAGQAVQNMNIMFGFKESAGLP